MPISRCHAPGLRARLAALGGPLAVVLLACAAPVGPAPEDAPPAPAPARGDDLARVRDVAEAAPAPGTRITVETWTELPVRGGRLVSAEQARGSGETDLAVVAHRICRRRIGWTQTREVARSSWYLLRGGALVAFDHPSFDAACRPSWHVRPASPADRPLERTLVRHLAQRHPAGQPGLAEALGRAEALAEAGRQRSVRELLEAADRRMATLRGRLDAGNLGEEARQQVQRELDLLRRRRAAAAPHAEGAVGFGASGLGLGPPPEGEPPAPEASGTREAEGAAGTPEPSGRHLLREDAPAPRPVAPGAP